MNWFGYIWIGLIAIPYIIWTVRAIGDFIDSIRYAKRVGEPLREEFNILKGWGLWLVVHIVLLFINSLVYCILYNVLR